MDFEEYLKKQEKELDVWERLDAACKKRKQIIGRYITIGFTDRVCLYVVVDETPRKYLLRFALGETVHPEWGHEIKLSKKKVEEEIYGRDYIEKIWPTL